MPTHTTQDSTNTKAPVADYSYFTTVWTQPQPWKMFDTVGHMAAYRYLSYQIIKDANGGNVDDIRAQYPSSSAGTFATKDPANYTWKGSFPAVWQDPVDSKSYTFTQQDWTDVSGQLSQELKALNNVITFMTPVKQSLVGDGNSSGITGGLAELRKYDRDKFGSKRSIDGERQPWKTCRTWSAPCSPSPRFLETPKVSDRFSRL